MLNDDIYLTNYWTVHYCSRLSTKQRKTGQGIFLIGIPPCPVLRGKLTAAVNHNIRRNVSQINHKKMLTNENGSGILCIKVLALYRIEC